MTPNQIVAASFALLSRGDVRGAEVELARVWNAGPPPPPPAVHLLGLIRRAQGRTGEAEMLMRQSIEADPQNAEYRNNLGRLLRDAGFVEHAVTAFEEALARNPRLRATRLNLARAYDMLGRAADAEREARAALAQLDDAEAWTALGGALRQQRRHTEALAAFEQALARDPKSRNARHDRAIALDKLGMTADAVAEYEALHAEGLRAQALYRNWAGALMDLGRHAEAEQRLLESVTIHPADVILHQSLAKLRWVRGDAAGFARDFLAAVAARPDDSNLRMACVDMLRRGDRTAEAAGLLEEGLRRAPDSVLLQAALGVLKAETGDFAAAEPLLRRGVEAHPHDFALRENIAATLLQAGKPAEALPFIRAARAERPIDCAWLAHEAVAQRMLGDPAYARLYDYDRVVRPYDLPLPSGWRDFDSFNADLVETLHRLHTLDAHPIDQSLRGGTQTSKSLLETDDPVIRAFLAALQEPLCDYIAAMPDDPAHPIFGRKPKSGRAKLVGCWSVRLKPGGYHVNHVHPEGWISSAYYAVVPPGVAGANDHQGWIQFGEPRWPVPNVTAERFVEPRAGRLVLFPSCMWHGTVPFRDGEERMTIAFDAVPD